MNFTGTNFFTRFLSLWPWSKVTPSRSTFFSNLIFNKDTPILINVEDLMRPYTDCPHLQIVINKRAEMMSNMQISLVDIDDEEKITLKHPVLDLLRKPTPLQNTEEWITQYSQYKDIFANNFIHKLRPTSVSFPKALWHLPSGLMEIVFTGKMFNQTDIADIIDKYILKWNSEDRDFDVADVIYKAENFIPEDGKGLSKIISLTLPISNIIASLKSRNIIITEKGMIGILSNQTKDVTGAIPLGTEERKRVEKQFHRDKNIYSDLPHIGITNAALSWQSMSFPMKEMMYLEEVEDDFSAILGAYGMDRDIFPSIKGATFENKKQGLISTYHNTIQPEADDLMNTLSMELGLIEQGLKLIADYSWLPIMQQDKIKEVTAAKRNVERLNLLLDKGIISREAYAEMAGVELTGEEPKEPIT